MLERDPVKRLSAKQVMYHPWIISNCNRRIKSQTSSNFNPQTGSVAEDGLRKETVSHEIRDSLSPEEEKLRQESLQQQKVAKEESIEKKKRMAAIGDLDKKRYSRKGSDIVSKDLRHSESQYLRQGTLKEGSMISRMSGLSSNNALNSFYRPRNKSRISLSREKGSIDSRGPRPSVSRERVERPRTSKLEPEIEKLQKVMWHTFNKCPSLETDKLSIGDEEKISLLSDLVKKLPILIPRFIPS
eukprot:TRINITY_DN11490_c0_g1_i1.p1 TRINITY_DN11490_c0_g1~~TRINITY_DN11490_c0_g1_i1.p1  ORF type:complete len:243 (-),score=29.76 TRINITY_DN11490_c0_g1_i1:93-821(-)